MRNIYPTLVSIATWAALICGLALIAVHSLTPRLRVYVEAQSQTAMAEAQLAEAIASIKRTERLVGALRTNRIFRDEWMRREWNIPLPARVETVRRADGDPFDAAHEPFAANARADSDAHPNGVIAAERLRILDAIGGSVAQGEAWLLLAAGALLSLGLTGPLFARRRPSDSSIRRLWSSVAGRYSLDSAHELAGPKVVADEQSKLGSALERQQSTEL